MDIKVPVEVSARHVHLSQKDMEILFGLGHRLRKNKSLSQSSDFASEEVISIKNGLKVLDNVRVVGPVRLKTQVEISKTDAFFLEVNPPLRISGDLSQSSGIFILGPAGKLEIKEGLIIAERHIHCGTKEAQKLKLKNNEKVSVKLESERPLTFHNVKIRVGDGYKLSLHIDTDEGNAAGINRIGEGKIIKESGFLWF